MKKDAIEIIMENGGQLRMSEAIKKGITRYSLYSMLDKGIIEKISRGIYRLAELPLISQPDLTTVSLRYPKAVIFLISALAYHEITTQIPHEVQISIPRGTRIPELDFPPIRTYRFSGERYSAGIEEHIVDGITIKVYDPEKTIVDSFKYRNKIGKDIFLEALKLYRIRKKINYNKIISYAKICRVEKGIKPYLEATL